ncbi:GUN4 domain-containing protein [Laspinema sp. A4]|uniref:GUN4 domain-containing protein n=1 Tax=Laspinema sp. D2d TaxID=2953686 RepID=UPI0021BA7927|nr:GUN4 domain-containing protein [Laspinema sp. D2d]MCT7985408.1 GUN4 domain-containing protein [Laspinema sp. D2d]
MFFGSFFVVCYKFNRRKELISKSRLRNFLAIESFKKADIETRKILLHLSDRTHEGVLRDIDIKNISCQDFQEIDNLWIRYSKGRFGYSIQRQIWKKHGLELETELVPTPYDPERLGYHVDKGFPVEVGWWWEESRVGKISHNDPVAFKRFYQLNFTLKAPIGHLPTHLRTVNRHSNGKIIDNRKLSSIDAVYLGELNEGCTLAIAQKIDECNL